jgi:hypothetical protein
MLTGMLTRFQFAQQRQVVIFQRLAAHLRVAGHEPGVKLQRIGAGFLHFLAEFDPAAERGTVQAGDDRDAQARFQAGSAPDSRRACSGNRPRTAGARSLHRTTLGLTRKRSIIFSSLRTSSSNSECMTMAAAPASSRCNTASML